MAIKNLLVAALAALPSVFASPAAPLEQRQTCKYSGTWAAFPARVNWIDFWTMVNNYRNAMLANGSTTQDIADMMVAVSNASAQYNINPAVLFAIILQESSGYVGVPCTGGNDCGVMQCVGCPGYPGRNSLGIDAISGMINGGALHFLGNINDHGGTIGAETIYPALREYNSGSVYAPDLSVPSNGYGVPCYVSDIARRLLGEVF